MIALGCLTSKSLRTHFSQVNSQHVKAMALYSASPVDLDVVVYFLDLQEAGDSPIITQSPEMNLLVSLHPAQFLNAQNWTKWYKLKWVLKLVLCTLKPYKICRKLSSKLKLMPDIKWSPKTGNAELAAVWQLCNSTLDMVLINQNSKELRKSDEFNYGHV